MPTNVTQKYETLKQVIDYCEKKINDIWHDIDICIEYCGVGDAVYSQLRGQVEAYEDIAGKCNRLLIRNGSIPVEGEE